MFGDYCLLLLDLTPRRYKVLVNLLNGRRTVSTLFWGQQYQLLQYYNAFHQLSLQRVEQELLTLQGQGLVVVDQAEATASLTAAGHQRQIDLSTELYHPRFLAISQYLNLHQTTPLLRLAFQVVSQATHSANQYYPVTSDVTIQQAVKSWYRQANSPSLAANLYQFLQQTLTKMEPLSAEILVADLTGYQHPGLTQQQLAQQLNLPSFSVELRLLDAWAEITQELLASDDAWTQLLRPLARQTRWSVSCEKSYRLFLQGASVDWIGQTRKIKVNTVKEHLLEAAIFDRHFPFQKLLPVALQTQLSQIYQGQVSTWQFQTILDQQLTVDFFHFRLFQIFKGAQADDSH